MMTPRLTVGVTTRDRPESLRNCLASLRLLSHLAPETIVFDDGSELQADVAAAEARLVRDPSAPGPIVGRNRIVREAGANFVLLLDDDAEIVDGAAVERGLALLERDDRIAAVGFPATGEPTNGPPAAAGGASAATVRYVAAFTGFAHMVRRETFLALGGYRERLVFYGEEKEFCLRVLDAGYRVVRLDVAAVAHHCDPAGRSRQRYLRYVTRNDCLDALYNQPLHRAAWIVPARLLLYFRMRRAWRVHDPFGWSWILSQLAGESVSIVRNRRPVSSRTLRLWRRLRDSPEPYFFVQP